MTILKGDYKMLNHINIMGRLTANPELKALNSGIKVASFRIACDRDYSSNGEKASDFIDCVAWRSTAEFLCRNFTKGMPILVSGRLQSRDYTDREGNKRKAVEINVADLYFCGGDRKTAAAAPAAPALVDLGDDDGDLPWDDSDDLPM
jgi:single-strand DNA-binding protein